MRSVVIAVAITGSVPTKRDNPAVPISVGEQIEASHECFEAGATLLHLHVRNDDETPSSDPSRFEQVKAGVERHCPGMIVQFSTGGRDRDPQQRGSSLVHRPDMASLSTGSVNFPNIVYENHPSISVPLATCMKDLGIRPEIEIFDLSHIYSARRLVDAGLVDEGPHVQFVLGIDNAMPARPELLDVLIRHLGRVLPLATWSAAGIGRHQTQVMDWALERGCDGVRTGFEDNVRTSASKLATSNAELVGIACERLARSGARPADAAEARLVMCLNTAPALRERMRA